MLSATRLLPSGERRDTQISAEVSVAVFILSEPEYWVRPPSAAATAAHLCSICLQNFDTKVVQVFRSSSRRPACPHSLFKSARWGWGLDLEGPRQHFVFDESPAGAGRPSSGEKKCCFNRELNKNN